MCKTFYRKRLLVRSAYLLYLLKYIIEVYINYFEVIRITLEYHNDMYARRRISLIDYSYGYGIVTSILKIDKYTTYLTMNKDHPNATHEEKENVL